MKKFIKNITPLWLLKWYKTKRNAKFQMMSTKDVFTEIYKSNHWKSAESISGTGSEHSQTETLTKELEKLMRDLNIKSVLDIPCGDFSWMQNLDLSDMDYTGADIVEDLVNTNIQKQKDKPNIKFKVINLISDPLPKCELIIVRDCLVHLSFDDILRALKNIRSSGSKYLLTTTFTNCRHNSDIITGDWRRLNMQLKPFEFPRPILVINEHCTEDNGAYDDKSMALWKISNIEIPQTL